MNWLAESLHFNNQVEKNDNALPKIILEHVTGPNGPKVFISSLWHGHLPPYNSWNAYFI